MKLLITILDIAALTVFSKNIDPSLVNPHIQDAQQFDVRLPEAVREELEAEFNVVLPSFKPGEFDSVDFNTEANIAGWKNLALAKVWYQAIRPLLVFEAAKRMILWHGLHMTPNGAESTANQPISPQERAALKADLQAKATHYRPLFEAGLRSLLPTTAPATCGPTRRRPSRGGLKTYVA